LTLTFGIEYKIRQIINTKKEQNQIQYRNGAKDVLFLESKMFFSQEQIMICAWKSNIFNTFSVLDLNPNEKKNTFFFWWFRTILWMPDWCPHQQISLQFAFYLYQAIIIIKSINQQFYDQILIKFSVDSKLFKGSNGSLSLI
jgi:hypothetical protein